MASRLEQDLSCPICHELYKDPVILSCSHSFCKVCLGNWWEGKVLKTCAVCMRVSTNFNPPLNLALKNLVETFTEGKTAPDEAECSLHSEKLRLYCMEHEKPVCLVCRDSKAHTDHSFRPIDEVAKELRKELKTNIKPLCDKLKVLHRSLEQMRSDRAHTQTQVIHTKDQIKAQFDKMHQFLKEEEESRMRALKEEVDQKTQRLKEQAIDLKKSMDTLSQTITETDKHLRSADVSFLLHYKTAAERVQRCPLVEEPQLEPGPLIDQTKHLGNLGFNVWSKMKSLVQFYPVLLDPNTANSAMDLSEDLSSVKYGRKRKYPDNPKRCFEYGVNGSEEFGSGTHSWDVEVGGSEEWQVGVSGYVQSGEETCGRLWYIDFCDNTYSAVCITDGQENTEERLSVENLQRVHVKLDFDTKTVTFSDPDTNTVLLTATGTFTKGLTPFLITGEGIPLKILPKNITVTV